MFSKQYLSQTPTLFPSHFKQHIVKDPNYEALKGDILSEENVEDAHYLIYLAPYPKNEDTFIAAMLTHSLANGNIPLQKDHFISKNEHNTAYKISFNKSLVANHPLYKKIDGAIFEKVGQLTPKGIAFIENNIAPYIQQFIS